MAITKASGQAVAPAAKGDLVVGSATNDAAVLSVGSANQVLTVDSSTTTGLKWAAPSAGANYSLLNSGGTALTASQTITISGISNYSKFYVLVKDVSSASASSTIGLRINADTGNNYYDFGGAQLYVSTSNDGQNARTSGAAKSSYPLVVLGANGASVGCIGLSIDGGNASGRKMIVNQSGVGGIDGAGGSDYNNSIMYNTMGYWDSSSTITSISLISSVGNFDAGTLYIYASA